MNKDNERDLASRIGRLIALAFAIGLAGLRGEAQETGYTVATMAGSFTVGNVDGPGAEARFGGAAGTAVDAQGNVYVADAANRTLRKISPSGLVSTLAGFPGATESREGAGSTAWFFALAAITCESNGVVYVFDNCTVRKVTTGGIVSTLAGRFGSSGTIDGIGDAARFNSSTGIAVDRDGNVYVTEWGSHVIRKITTGGVVRTLAGLANALGSSDGAGAAARFNNPAGVCVDAQGNLFVADQHNQMIRKITPTGVVTTIAGGPGRGVLLGTGDGIGVGASFLNPQSIAIDGRGNLLVTEWHRVRKISPLLEVTTIAGTGDDNSGVAVDGVGAAVRFSIPHGISADQAGNFFLTDGQSRRIRKGTPPQSPQAPVITSQPASQTASVGASITLGISAEGNSPVSYQWRKDGVPIAGATGPALTLANIRGEDAGSYTVAVTNALGTVVSNAAVLSVDGVPRFTQQPVSRRVDAGAPVTLSVDASGSPRPTLQWRRNGFPIPGATDASYVIPAATMLDAGWYQVVATNVAGVIKSAAAFVNVAAKSPRIVTWGSATTLSQFNIPTNPGDIAAVAAGHAHLVALRSNGSVVCWGANQSGESTVPAGLSNVVAVAAGGNNSAALNADGTVVVWGDNSQGQRNVPANARDIVSLAVGSSHVLALKADGTVIVWGGSAVNAVNAGFTIVPPGLADVAAIASGPAHNLALRANGTVVGWGNRMHVQSSGALIGWFPYPAAVVPDGLQDVVAIATGHETTVALRGDGSLWVWNEQIRQANTSAVPRDIVAVCMGMTQGFALRRAGSLVALTAESTIPAGLSGVVAVSAGTTFTAALTSVEAPAIRTQAASVTASVGSAATFSVAATGSPAPTYQWRRNGIPIAGATSATLTLTNLAIADAGAYTVVVSNPSGSVTSAPATLEVSPAAGPGARLINLSVLTTVTAEEPSFKMGTVLGGRGTSGNKAIVIRAAGPSLVPLGVLGALNDPRIEVFGSTPSGMASVAVNDNWGGSSGLASAMAQVGAFAFANPSSADAALSANFPAGDYVVDVSGVRGATGTVIAELYDATPAASVTATTPRLVNVSVLKHIGSGLIAGFVISGAGNKAVLIRAVGPGLVAFGVGGVVADPRIELFGGASRSIDSNDNWGGTAALNAASTAVGAFALEATSRDAALVATLQPGNYSVQVSGVGGATGVALVEVYEVP